MIINYIKIAFRNLRKRRGHTFLNIAGLTIGMTCCLLIFHYVSYERSYDDFHKDANDIVRLRIDSYRGGELRWKSATVYPAIAPTMKKDFPEVQDFCRLIDADLLITNEITQAKFSEKKGYFADQSTLKMFNIPLVQGSPATALTGPDKMIISTSMATKYFGRQDALGKQLKVLYDGFTQNYEISGVFKDYPVNSHLDIKYLVSYDAFKKTLLMSGDSSDPAETAWGWYDFYAYIQLKPGTDIDQFAAKVPAFSDRHMNSRESARKNNNKTEIHLMPLKDIHLYSNFNQEAEVNGNGQAVGFLFLVAIFIIGIAWINYINLATARSVERAREVGVRKVLGALRTDLIKQFLTESLLLNIVSLVLSIGIFYALIIPFDRFTGHPDTHISLSPHYWQLFTILFVAGTFLSGLYPAFVLSGFQPIKVLKGMFKNSVSGLLLRKGLIVLQFTTSVVLIAGTIIVYRQVSFMRDQKLGANIDQTLVLEGSKAAADTAYKNTFLSFKTAVTQQSGVKKMAASTNVMGQEIYWTNTHKRVDASGESGNTLYSLGIDAEFIPLFDMKLVAGRNFADDFGTERKNILLNETAIKILGFPNIEAAIGKKINSGRDTNTVVGVLADYHHQGLQKAIEPMIFRFRPGNRNFYSIKVATGNLPATIATIKNTWDKHFPADPFNYTFLDETFSQQYKADILFGKVFGIFAFLAILIACFGLLGLSAYNVIQRTKEIGIRKVLGASAQSILVLLSKDFMKLIMVALVLAIPVGWYIMHQWLQDFAYRISIGWWIFATAGILALLIALLTILLQAARAVVENPVKSLRSE
ncbi:FtsX-like permease family protein [Pseudoflavitalea sp. X16]|uniref:ABC transporter permease n=1 Tax=Paraflavitalea devenefica TaxID=2716334 RepID=UPI00141E7D86|nr:ABC transporter permease [Paraflavitalea devenefica]NII28014.1 FtsX-like permease family protein [Paraflavitalea devenefica]